MPLGKLLCDLSGHAAPERSVWNDNHHFGCCARCGAELCREPSGSWQAIPPGFRVVWKPRGDVAVRTPVVWDGRGRGARA